MASFYSMAGGPGFSMTLGAPSGASTQPGTAPGSSQTKSQQQSGQYFQSPESVNQITNMLTSLAGQAQQQYLPTLQNFGTSPTFQAQYRAMEAAREPQFQKALQNVTDAARAAGGLRGGAYMNTLGQVLGEIMGQQGIDYGKLMSSTLPIAMQSLQQPMSLADQLVNALKMSQSSGSSLAQSQGFAPQTGGGGGGSIGGSSIPSVFDPAWFGGGGAGSSGYVPIGTAPASGSPSQIIDVGGNQNWSGILDSLGGGSDFGGGLNLGALAGDTYAGDYGGGFDFGSTGGEY